MRFSKLLTLLFLGLGMTACSEQTRKASAQINDEELTNLYSEIMGSSASSNSGVDKSILQQLLEDPNSIIYHVGSQKNRPAVSVLSVNDFSFVDAAFQDAKYTSYDVGMQNADVIFIDGHLNNSDRRFAVLMRLESENGNIVYFSRTSEANAFRFTDSSFRVEMTGANGERIVFKSTDVSTKDSKKLNSSIKLDIWIDDGSQEFYTGQVSTMSGFGGT